MNEPLRAPIIWCDPQKENAPAEAEAPKQKHMQTDDNTGAEVLRAPAFCSVFADASGSTVKSGPATWLDLVAALQIPDTYASKGASPLLKLAAFGGVRTPKGCLRHDDNIVEVYGVEADYDAELISVDRAGDMLATHGIEAVIYTTASHTNERPRWRVLAPLSRPHSPAERAGLVAKINYALGGILASESFTLSQSFYFGRVEGVPYQVRHVRGEFVDDSLVLDELFPDDRKGRQPLERDDMERQITLASVTDETVAEVRSALAVFTEQDADSYHVWAEQVGQALKSLAQAGREIEAREMWHEFSAKSEKYDRAKCDHKWDRDLDPNRITYKSIFEWATSRGWLNPKSAQALKASATAETRLDRTDAGNTSLLATLTDGDLRYVPEYKSWLWWDGQRWERDTYGSKAVSAALQVAEHYHQKAADIRAQSSMGGLDDKERDKIDKVAKSLEQWATRCRSKSSIDNMLGLAKADGRFTLPAEKLDRDPWLFGVDNGVVDLRTGELRPAGRDDLVTKRSPVRFDPSARAPRWLQFIEEVTATPSPNMGKAYTSRPALGEYLQRSLGYAMTGSTAEHKMFMAIGEGSNGKNVLLDLMQWIMGGYCETIAPEALMASRHDADAERATPSARKLAGARVAISSESKEGQRLDVALVKRHTGGGFMTARALHENAFTFEITHKLWLMTNHKPALDHMDEAMRGRLHMIPFDMRWNRPGHPERDPNLPDGDKSLPEKLKAEAEGVLAWLIAGALCYVRDGLEPPSEVVNMTRDYFKDQDPIGLWLDTCERCEVSKGGTAAELFDLYRSWCADEEFGVEVAGSQTSFSKNLKSRGVIGQKTKSGQKYALRAQKISLV